METPLLTVDIGNTRTKFCLWQNFDACSPVLEFADSSSEFDSTEGWIENNSFLKDIPAYWIISSVNSSKCQRLREIVRDHRPDDRFRLVTIADIPIEICYEYPQRLGIDRAIAAYAGIALLGGGRPFLVVDVGTAATIDYVNEQGVFCGGAILPGSRLAAEALQTRTACLPLIADPENENLQTSDRAKISELFKYPATETEQAIRTGIGFSLVGAITTFYWRVCRQIQEEGGASARLAIILAGGDAALIASNLQSYFDDLESVIEGSILRPEVEIDQRLILNGLKKLACVSTKQYGGTPKVFKTVS